MTIAEPAGISSAPERFVHGRQRLYLADCLQLLAGAAPETSDAPGSAEVGGSALAFGVDEA